MPYELFLTSWLGFNLVFGALTAYLASRWGRDPFGWLLVGAILGPIALVLLLVERRRDTHATRPSLSGPGAPGQPGRPSVLIAVDGSAFSDQAVNHVVEDFGASLDVASVVAVLPIERAEGVAMGEGSQRRRLLEEEAGRHLESACSTLRNAGIQCKTTIRFGDPATEIVRLGEEIRCDLIVLGRRGRGKAVKLLLGSVSEKVAKEAGCPVTVIG